MAEQRTIAEQLYRSLGIYTRSFNLPEEREVVRENKERVWWLFFWLTVGVERWYRFADGSELIISDLFSDTQGKAVWSATLPRKGTKLVGVYAKYRR